MRACHTAHSKRHKHTHQEQAQSNGAGFGKDQRNERNHRLCALQLAQVRRFLAQEEEIPRLQRILCGAEQGTHNLLSE